MQKRSAVVVTSLAQNPFQVNIYEVSSQFYFYPPAPPPRFVVFFRMHIGRERKIEERI